MISAIVESLLLLRFYWILLELFEVEEAGASAIIIGFNEIFLKLDYCPLASALAYANYASSSSMRRLSMLFCCFYYSYLIYVVLLRTLRLSL